MSLTRRTMLAALAAASVAAVPAAANQAERQEIDAKARAALDRLYAENAAAKELGGKARGILILPEITKAGFVVGGEAGKGVLRVGGGPVGYYRVVSASIGLQIGAETYSQVLMFMSDKALEKFRASEGWEAGVDGTVTVVKQGANVGADTTVGQAAIVGFVFGQQGLMAGASIEGSKYTKLDI